MTINLPSGAVATWNGIDTLTLSRNFLTPADALTLAQHVLGTPEMAAAVLANDPRYAKAA